MQDPIRKTLVDLARFLRQERIPFAIIGGIAASIRGEPRFTADIDITAGTDIAGALELLRHTRGSSFAPLIPEAAEIVQASLILPLRHRTTGIQVDAAVGLSGFERRLIDRAKPVRWGKVSIKIATAEDLILLKLIAGRPRDLEDIRGILSRARDRLEWRYLTKTARELEAVVDQDLVAPLEALRRKSGRSRKR